jgi:threonine dehydratase
VSAVVVVPETAPLNKIEKIRGYGAKVIIEGATYDDASSLAHDIAEKASMVYVPSFDDPDIVAGNGSIGLEIMEDVPEAEAILCPIGGGGGISGVVLAAKQVKPEIEVYGVEADEAASMQASLDAGMPLALTSANTVADGIAVCRPGDFNYRVVNDFVDGVLTVSDGAMKAAVALLAKDVKVVAECAGAATVAALLAGKLETDARTVVCMVSGGNIDTALLCSILENSV